MWVKTGRTSLLELCHHHIVKSVQNFTYLGCVISSDNSIDLEITRKIQSDASAFGALDARVWSQRGIKLATKCKLYRVFCPTMSSLFN